MGCGILYRMLAEQIGLCATLATRRTGLTHVHLANCKGLEEIEDKAFCGCTSLSKIVIPPAVRRSKDQAFEGCMIVTDTVDATM